MKRVGILTSGGDCQALNATMRGVGKGLYNELGSDVAGKLKMVDPNSGIIEEAKMIGISFGD